MSKRKWPLVFVVLLALSLASSASAATSWKHLGANPFSRATLRSEADLRTLVQTRGADLEAGFVKAGSPGLYPAFRDQFPTAKIDSVSVAPGESFAWMVFQNKSSRKVAVLKDVTWKGAKSFDAFRFYIDHENRRHEFVVPYLCGNVALRGLGPIPAPAVFAPTPPAPAPAPVAAPAPARVVAPPPAVVVPPPPPPPTVAAPPAPFAPPAAPALSVPAPVEPVCVPVPAPPPPARAQGGPLFDVGLARQPDPANYLFARVGYELPLAERLYLIGLVGGSLRWMGNDGGGALTADVLLDYHWLSGYSFGVGAGFWSGNDGQVDLLADIGYLVSGDPVGNNWSLFLEARLPFEELDNPNDYGRFGLGLRYRF